MPLYSALSGPSVACIVQFSCLSARKESKLEQVQGRASSGDWRARPTRGDFSLTCLVYSVKAEREYDSCL